MCSRSGLMAVNGLMSQAQQGSLILARGVAGGMVQLVGANSCFIYDGFSFFFSAALVMTLTIERQAPRTESSAVLNSMRQGFGFIFKLDRRFHRRRIAGARPRFGSLRA